MVQKFGSVSVEEHGLGTTRWVAIRARGAEWSWLTPEDALLIAQHSLATYGAATTAHAVSTFK